MPGVPRQTARRLLLALALLTLLRLVLSAVLPLAPDEAYYWVWSRALAPGYLDAPPMVAWWIRLGTALGGETTLGVRLLAALAAAAGALLLADAGGRLWPRIPGTGLRAALLISATPLLGVGAIIMTPDTPLMFFWTLALWALARVPAAEAADTGKAGGGIWFLVAGVAVGCALDAKYTALFLPIGVLIWLMTVPAMRPWLVRPAPWLAALIALLIFAPVLLWNVANGGASFLKQGGRLGDFVSGRAWQFEAELIGGQIGLASPLIWLLCVAGLWAALRGLAGKNADRRGAALVLATTLPAALIFLIHALGDRVQGNWPAILYPGAALAAGALTGLGGRPARLLRPAVILGAVFTLAIYAQALWGVLPIPPARDPTALQMAGWRSLSAAVAGAAQRAGRPCVTATNYGMASELAFYAPPGLRVIAAGPRWGFFRLPVGGCAGKGMLLRRVAEPRADAPPDMVQLARRHGMAGGERAIIAHYTLAPEIADPLPAAVLPRP